MLSRLVNLGLVSGLVLSGTLAFSNQLQPALAGTNCNCSQYLGKGYCTDYIRAKLGSKTPRGDAKNFPTNTKTPTANTVAVFNWSTYGHVAWVESVDNKNKTFTVSHWNYSSVDVNKCCAVTGNFGKVTRTTFKFNASGLTGFYDPNKR